jgi:cytochrome c oxidase cbb3-type subunit I/II
MWRAFDETGRLAYPGLRRDGDALMPMYWVRVAGGTLYIIGTLIFGYNI